MRQMARPFRCHASASHAILDKRLADRSYVLGDEPTITDLSLVGYLYYAAEEFGYDPLAGYSNVSAWLARIKALPRWAHPYDLMPGHPLPT
jgi:glutathione S-transferase